MFHPIKYLLFSFLFNVQENTVRVLRLNKRIPRPAIKILLSFLLDKLHEELVICCTEGVGEINKGK